MRAADIKGSGGTNHGQGAVGVNSASANARHRLADVPARESRCAPDRRHEMKRPTVQRLYVSEFGVVPAPLFSLGRILRFDVPPAW